MGDQLGLPEGRAGQLVRAQRQEDGAGLQPPTVRYNDAIARGTAGRSRRRRRARRHRGAAVHRRHHRRAQRAPVLLHRNLIANVLQSEAWNEPVMKRCRPASSPPAVCALPLYHIFAFTVNMMLSMRTGGKTILIPTRATCRPRSKSCPSTPSTVSGRQHAVQRLANHPDFNTVNWKNLKARWAAAWRCRRGGQTVARKRPAARSVEGYGLSETSPTASCNPVTATEFTGTIGLPLPGTWMKMPRRRRRRGSRRASRGDRHQGPAGDGRLLAAPDETAKVMTPDGYFKSGDIGIMDERGFFRIVDRKKDMILVSGFNVYPNEIEDVVAAIPACWKCAAVICADEKMGEAVKLVIVKKDPGLTEEAGARTASENLTGYKQPKIIEFRTELPKTPSARSCAASCATRRPPNLPPPGVGDAPARHALARRMTEIPADRRPQPSVAPCTENWPRCWRMPDEQRQVAAGANSGSATCTGRTWSPVLSAGKVAAATTATR